MEWLNYHHLLYFWQVAREGSLSRACARLLLAPSTVSKQIHQLEEVLGHPLFVKSGRRLTLTEIGRVTYRYADEIFGLGRELQSTLAERPEGRPLRLSVGIADVVPKLIAQRVLQSAGSAGSPVHLVCREDKPDRLVAELVLLNLDVILTDAPASPHVNAKAFSHLLGDYGVTLFAKPAEAARLRRGFPGSLNGAPMLLPTENTMLRRTLDVWLDSTGIRPNIVGEFEDSALLMVFGQRGPGSSLPRHPLPGKWSSSTGSRRSALFPACASGCTPSAYSAGSITRPLPPSATRRAPSSVRPTRRGA